LMMAGLPVGYADQADLAFLASMLMQQASGEELCIVRVCPKYQNATSTRRA
jgi:hypothetical protein